MPVESTDTETRLLLPVLVACLLLLLLPLAPTSAAVAGSLLLWLWCRRAGAPSAVAPVYPLGGMAGALALFLAVCVIGTVFSLDVRRSLQTVFKLLPGLLLVATWYRLRTAGVGPQREMLATALRACVALALVAFVGSEVFYGGYVVSTSGLVPLFSRNSISVALLVMLAAALALGLHQSRLRYAVVAIFLLGLLLANGARGGLLAGAGIAGFVFLRALGFSYGRILLAGIVTVVIGAGLVFVFQDQLAAARHGNLMTGRDYLWRAAVHIIQDHPWTGIGINTWKYLAYVDQLAGPWPKEAGPHNIVLDVLSATGILGAAVLIACVAVFVRALRSVRIPGDDAVRDFGMLLVLGMLLNGMVDFRVFSVQFISLTGVGLVLWLPRDAFVPAAAQQPAAMRVEQAA